MDEQKFDVAVVGAGAAGLIAALEIAMTGRKVILLEASKHIGGRIRTWTGDGSGFPFELGAEFVHGKLSLTRKILEKAGCTTYEVTGEIFNHSEGKLKKQSDFIADFSKLEKQLQKLEEDIPVASFIENYLQGDEYEKLRTTLKNYVEGYYAADLSKASTSALKEELAKSDEEQYRIDQGYGQMVNWLEDSCKKNGVTIITSSPVKEIRWKKDEVLLQTSHLRIVARKALITVSLGVLQSESISFAPSLTRKMAAARHLGFGPVVKILLLFDEAFWQEKQNDQPDLHQLSFVFSEAPIPTWWTSYPKKTPLLTGWAAGPNARKLKDLGNEEILQIALDSIKMIFGFSDRKKLKQWTVISWLREPFICGGYSYDVVDGQAAKEVLRAPEEETLFFAGEGLFEGTSIGTVEAALVNGREAAHRLVAAFKS
jgi:monoamine oxidase